MAYAAPTTSATEEVPFRPLSYPRSGNLLVLSPHAPNPRLRTVFAVPTTNVTEGLKLGVQRRPKVEAMAERDSCSVEGCERPAWAKGLCPPFFAGGRLPFHPWIIAVVARHLVGELFLPVGRAGARPIVSESRWLNLEENRRAPTWYPSRAYAESAVARNPCPPIAWRLGKRSSLPACRMMSYSRCWMNGPLVGGCHPLG
jgi:hypothetical protein